MTARSHLSEEAEREETDEREKLRALQPKLRELRARHQMVLAEVNRLSDEERALHNERRPGESEVERIHFEYRELGALLATTRRDRDEARRRFDDALAAVREFRASLPRGNHAQPEEIRREIRKLEHAQQTTALPLREENALIDQLRRLAHSLTEAERDRGVAAERQKRMKELEVALAERRSEVARLTDELQRGKTERERRMQSIRDRLVDAGRIVAGLRATSKARSAAIDRLRALGAQIEALEREADRLVHNSRTRRQEARQVVTDYNRTVRGSLTGEAAATKAADDQLEELLKRGRVTLRG